jgi:hypothetical protein
MTSATAASLAGCSSSDDTNPSGSDNSNGNPSNEEPEPPKILEVNLVSDFEDFGDVSDKAIQSAPSGDTIYIGYRHKTWVHDGQFKITSQVEVYDSSESRIAFDNNQDEQLVDGAGTEPKTWEGAMAFTADWDPGEYTALVTIRDDITDEVSSSKTGAFQITKPEPKLVVTQASKYEDQYSSGVRGFAKNVSDETLSYAEVNIVFLDDDGRQLDSGLDNTSGLAPGREWKFDVGYYGDSDFSDYEISTDW